MVALPSTFIAVSVPSGIGRIVAVPLMLVVFCDRYDTACIIVAAFICWFPSPFIAVLSGIIAVSLTTSITATRGYGAFMFLVSRHSVRLTELHVCGLQWLCYRLR